MILGQLVHEGLVAAVGTGDTLAADNKNMLHDLSPFCDQKRKVSERQAQF